MTRTLLPDARPASALRRWRCGTCGPRGARSLIAIAGIGFATVMVLLQLGFLEAVRFTASINYDQLDFDVVLVSPEFEQFYDPGTFPRERLRQAEALEAVARGPPALRPDEPVAMPPLSGDGRGGGPDAPPQVGPLRRWWLGRPASPTACSVRDLLVLGIDLDRNPFRDPIRDQVEAARPRLRTRGRLLLNAWSQPRFRLAGPPRVLGLGAGRPAVEVVGGFTLQRSFGADAAVLCDHENFARVSASRSAGPRQLRPARRSGTGPWPTRSAASTAACRPTSRPWRGRTCTGASRITGSARRPPARSSPSASS